MASQSGHAEALRELLKCDLNVNTQSDDGMTSLMVACLMGHLMAATILIAAGSEINLLSNAGLSSLAFAEFRVARDALPPAAGREAPTAAQRLERARLVAVLKGHALTLAA